jgi:hypothetical protein
LASEELALKQHTFRLERWRLRVSTITAILLGVLTYVVNNAVQERGSMLKREEQILAEKQKYMLTSGDS